jgi:hypothetical protein
MTRGLILGTSETGLKGIGNGLYFSHIVEKTKQDMMKVCNKQDKLLK